MIDPPPADGPDSPLDPEAEDEDEANASVALVSTLEPLAVKVSEIPDDRIPDGMACMGAFIEGRLIARSAVPPEMILDLRDRDVFADPVRIALAAVEQDPGLQCRLFALLPAAQFQEQAEEKEPWASSVPSFEEEQEAEEGEEDAVVPLLLGHIVRFTHDRKHPEDLAAEAADILHTILVDDTPMSNVVDKILEDLLDS